MSLLIFFLKSVTVISCRSQNAICSVVHEMRKWEKKEIFVCSRKRGINKPTIEEEKIEQGENERLG